MPALTYCEVYLLFDVHNLQINSAKYENLIDIWDKNASICFVCKWWKLEKSTPLILRIYRIYFGASAAIYEYENNIILELFTLKMSDSEEYEFFIGKSKKKFNFAHLFEKFILWKLNEIHLSS